MWPNTEFLYSFFQTFRIFKKLNIFWGMELLLARSGIYSEHEILVWFRKPPEIWSFCQSWSFDRNILRVNPLSAEGDKSHKWDIWAITRVMPSESSLGCSKVNVKMVFCVEKSTLGQYFTENKQLLGTRVQQKSLVAGQIYNLSRGRFKLPA